MNVFKPLSQKDIRATVDAYDGSLEGSRLVNESNFSAASLAGYIFLSHSSRDKELAKKFARYMEKYGVKTYIDLYDSSLMLPPSADTAEKLKMRIRNAKSLVLLATQNSVHGSSWCPWEVGYADGIRKAIGIAATEDGSKTYGAEFLDLYPAVSMVVPKDGNAPWMALQKYRKNGLDVMEVISTSRL